MFSVDTYKFKERLKRRGYASIGELARRLGVHRNSIHFYLSGNRVFPEVFEKLLAALDLEPSEILVKKEEEPAMPEKIARLIDELRRESPDAAFVLFGSRTRGRTQKYSDWDIGVYSRRNLDHAQFRKLFRKKEDLAEDLPCFVDLVNLNRADSHFLFRASKNWKFLSGSVQDWLDLQKKVSP